MEVSSTRRRSPPHEEVMTNLVAIGIPRQQVAAISDAESDVENQALFEDVRHRESTLFRDCARKSGPCEAVELNSNYRQQVVDARAIRAQRLCIARVRLLLLSPAGIGTRSLARFGGSHDAELGMVSPEPRPVNDGSTADEGVPRCPDDRTSDVAPRGSAPRPAVAFKKDGRTSRGPIDEHLEFFSRRVGSRATIGTGMGVVTGDVPWKVGRRRARSRLETSHRWKCRLSGESTRDRAKGRVAGHTGSSSSRRVDVCTLEQADARRSKPFHPASGKALVLPHVGGHREPP
jgi:hypothetical protein